MTSRSDAWRNDFPDRRGADRTLKRRLYFGDPSTGFPRIHLDELIAVTVALGMKLRRTPGFDSELSSQVSSVLTEVGSMGLSVDQVDGRVSSAARAKRALALTAMPRIILLLFVVYGSFCCGVVLSRRLEVWRSQRSAGDLPHRFERMRFEERAGKLFPFVVVILPVYLLLSWLVGQWLQAHLRRRSIASSDSAVVP